MAWTVHLIGVVAGTNRADVVRRLEKAIGVDGDTDRALLDASPLALERNVEERRARELEATLATAGVRASLEETADEVERPAISTASGPVQGADTELELHLDDVEAMLRKA